MRLNIFKSLFGFFVATAAVSCSNDQVIDELRPAGGETDMISFMVADDLTRGGSFGNRPGTSTRGDVVNGVSDIDKIAVFGNFDNSSKKIVLFNGTKVQNDNGAWTYSDIRYWFKGEYNFAAIYPATAPAIKDLNFSDNNSLSFTYSPADYTESVDILTATHHRFYKSGPASKVTFTLQHIFSRINFIAKVDPTSSQSFVIKRLVLKNVKTSGEYVITPAPTTTEIDDFYANWNTSDSKGTLFDYDSEKEAVINKNATFTFFPNDHALMLIPQEVPSDVTIEITYYPEDNKADEKTIPVNLYETTVSAHRGKWERGHTYTYSFSLGDNESIIFNSPTIQKWEEAEGGNYIVTDKYNK